MRQTKRARVFAWAENVITKDNAADIKAKIVAEGAKYVFLDARAEKMARLLILLHSGPTSASGDAVLKVRTCCAAVRECASSPFRPLRVDRAAMCW